MLCARPQKTTHLKMVELNLKTYHLTLFPRIQSKSPYVLFAWEYTKGLCLKYSMPLKKRFHGSGTCEKSHICHI